MNPSNKSVAPDFQVQWQNDSAQAEEEFYCERSVDAMSDESFVRAVAMLYTPTTHVIVSELNWNEATDLEFTPNRPGFSALISASSLIEYGYGADLAKSAQLGRVMFMVPGKAVHSRQTPGVMRAITCSFESEYAESILGRSLSGLSESQITNALDVRSSLISAVLLRLMHEALHPGPLHEQIVESFGKALLVECAHWLAVDESAVETSGKLTARHLAIIEDLLTGASGAFPSVTMLAGACGFSERYFAKLFREHMSCSIGQYIKSVQMMRAKSYLLETDLPLKEIAFRLGFSTPANFSSAFRVATGHSPGQFRKEQSQ